MKYTANALIFTKLKNFVFLFFQFEIDCFDEEGADVHVMLQTVPLDDFFVAHRNTGHAILHKQLVLHRDRSMDGSAITKSLEEIQADKFATYFLMPTKAVIITFQQRFATQKFIIDPSTVLAIGANSVSGLRNHCENLRGLARVLASVDYYDGERFTSLAKAFGVSVETMAIRLEELDLLKF